MEIIPNIVIKKLYIPFTHFVYKFGLTNFIILECIISWLLWFSTKFKSNVKSYCFCNIRSYSRFIAILYKIVKMLIIRKFANQRQYNESYNTMKYIYFFAYNIEA